METPSNENSEHSTTPTNDAGPSEDNSVPNATDHGGEEQECKISEEEVKGTLEVNASTEKYWDDMESQLKPISETAKGIYESQYWHDLDLKPVSEEAVKCVLKVIASTGKFWHDWSKLKSILSLQLKQVLSEYPEAKMTTEQQNASLGETYLELVKRLDEALLSFVDGPPFTLQRLCEILLEGQSIYPNLSKLALALEKNLLVTSMLAISTDPYPEPLVSKPDEPGKASEEPKPPPDLVENGAEPVEGDADEVMTDVEEAEIDDEMTIDMETFEEIVGSSEPKSTPAADS